METLDKGKKKLGEICDILRKETLEPAQTEASHIIENANVEAAKIIEAAKAESSKILDEAQKKIDQEKKLFENSIDLAAKQTFNNLREKVQREMFNEEVLNLSNAIVEKSELVAKIVAAIVDSIEKEGLESNLSLELGKNINSSEISQFLVGKLAERLKGGDIPIESIGSGAKVVLGDQKMSVDVSEQSLKDLLGSFLKDSFKEILFKNV